MLQPPLMELAEAVVTLLDSCWFEREIFGKKTVPGTMLSGPVPLNLDQDIAELSLGSRTADISRFPSMLSRSMSDQLSSTASFFLDSSSPNSVFLSSQSHLHPVESGKEIPGEVMFGSEMQNRGNDDWRRSRRRKAMSKSLSELEFEELKGFMDLGFVFSEEDKDSTLATIIPGLHRLGKKDEEEKQEEDEQGEETQADAESQESLQIVSIPRPYLSETWEWLDRTRKKEEAQAQAPLVNWNFPALSNETDMKDNLRWWAHTVASAVR